MKRLLFLLVLTGLFGGCSDSGDSKNDTADAGLSDVEQDTGPTEIALSYAFDDGAQGWESDFTDYPDGAADAIAFASGLRPLPDEVSELGQAYYLEGTNESADIFLFVRKKLGADDGLSASTAYKVDYEITFVSNYPADCSEERGQLMHLKMGASPYKPANVPTSDNSAHELNLEKGNHELGGEAASAAGNLTHDEACVEVYDRYVPVTRAHSHPGTVSTTDDGTMWLLVGVDSEVRGENSFYFSTIDVTLTPADD